MIKRIALQVEKDPGCERRTAAAAALAARFQAELVGIHVAYAPPSYLYDRSYVPAAVFELMQQRLDEDRAACEQVFRRHASRAGIAAQWRAPVGRADDLLAHHARCTDLLIMSQPDDNDIDAVITLDMAESIMLAAGRPVLMLPHSGDFPTIGGRILFCWDHGREAARALADAAAFLASAREVVALTLDAETEAVRRRVTVPEDLQAYFHAHGYPRPESVARDIAGLAIGDAILNAAADYGCDLVVMGLYGHSRAREWVLGGASRAMLQSMTVPVLFSH